MKTVKHIAREKRRHSIGALINGSDLVLECSGDPGRHLVRVEHYRDLRLDALGEWHLEVA